MAKTRPRVGPHSQRGILARLDGRGELARRMRDIRNELIDALGGQDHVTPQRKLLVDGLCYRVIRSQMLIAAAVMHEGFSEENDRRINWHLNGVRTDLLALGLDRPQEQVPTLTAYIEGRSEAA